MAAIRQAARAHRGPPQLGFPKATPAHYVPTSTRGQIVEIKNVLLAPVVATEDDDPCVTYGFNFLELSKYPAFLGAMQGNDYWRMLQLIIRWQPAVAFTTEGTVDGYYDPDPVDIPSSDISIRSQNKTFQSSSPMTAMTWTIPCSEIMHYKLGNGWLRTSPVAEARLSSFGNFFFWDTTDIPIGDKIGNITADMKIEVAWPSLHALQVPSTIATTAKIEVLGDTAVDSSGVGYYNGAANATNSPMLKYDTGTAVNSTEGGRVYTAVYSGTDDSDLKLEKETGEVVPYGTRLWFQSPSSVMHGPSSADAGKLVPVSSATPSSAITRFALSAVPAIGTALRVVSSVGGAANVLLDKVQRFS